MLIQTKFQIDRVDYAFIKTAHKTLNYKSLSEYMREAVHVKVEADRRRVREAKRDKAMEMIGTASPYENIFESIEGEDFEVR
ncbi:MAG: crotonobetainyl-CoA--carnitine CoA-transferase [Syntrophales bacterium]